MKMLAIGIYTKKGLENLLKLRIKAANIKDVAVKGLKLAWPEVIENFMQYLTGYRLSQEDAVSVHTLLYEDSIILAGDHH